MFYPNRGTKEGPTELSAEHSHLPLRLEIVPQVGALTRRKNLKREDGKKPYRASPDSVAGWPAAGRRSTRIALSVLGVECSGIDHLCTVGELYPSYIQLLIRSKIGIS